MYEIKYYFEKESCPVMDFISKLNPKEQAKILREIDLIQQFGLYLGYPYIKKLEGSYNKLWELRIKHSSNNFRIFYFCFHQGKFILLHGIRKTSKKTPKIDLDISLKRMADYLKGCDQSESR